MAEGSSVQVWKVGSLASATGLTVRTLHHYDHIGLVSPSGRTPSGHRLYEESDVRRLYQVLALRQEQYLKPVDEQDQRRVVPSRSS